MMWKARAHAPIVERSRRMFMRMFVRAGALVVAATAGLNAQARPAVRKSVPAVHATTLSSVEGITEYALPNGLHVLLFPDQSKPTVTVNVTYLVDHDMKGTAKAAWPTSLSTCSSRAPRTTRTFRRS